MSSWSWWWWGAGAGGDCSFPANACSLQLQGFAPLWRGNHSHAPCRDEMQFIGSDLRTLTRIRMSSHGHWIMRIVFTILLYPYWLMRLVAACGDLWLFRGVSRPLGARKHWKHGAGFGTSCQCALVWEDFIVIMSLSCFSFSSE